MSITETTLRLNRQLRRYLSRILNTQTRQLVQAWAAAWDDLVPYVEGAADAVLDADPVVRSMVLQRSERAARALQIIARQLDDLTDGSAATITGDVSDVVGTFGHGQAGLVASQMPAQAGSMAVLQVAFDRVDELALSAIVERSTQRITSLTRPVPAATMRQIARTLVTGIAMGDNPRATARAIVRRTEGAFNGGLTRALVISRTEMLDASRAGAMAGQAPNSSMLAGWRWVSALDARTCPSCFSQHGSLHPLDEPGPFDHQQGRCARVPETKTWRQLGFDIDEPPSVLPDARTVFRSMPKVDQLRVMGPARLQALDAGDIGWADLSTVRANPGWRPSMVPTPVRALVPA